MFTVAPNWGGVRLNRDDILDAADTGGLPPKWLRHRDRPEVLELRLPLGRLSSHDDIVRWFDEGLRKLHQAGVLNEYLSGYARKQAEAAQSAAARLGAGGSSDLEQVRVAPSATPLQAVRVAPAEAHVSRPTFNSLIERLPENLVPDAIRSLEAVLLAAAPVALAIENGGEEDAPLSPEGRQRLEEGLEDVRRAEVLGEVY